MKEVFKNLFTTDVSKYVEQKKNLNYLSWTYAWAEVKKQYPDASYNIWKDQNGNPYTFSETLGYMCYTTVCIKGETLEMWLPVMNGANKAMLSKKYTYTTKYGEKEVEPASMFDINKTIMRCLVKNLAMFGLGLYIYAGEDLPEKPHLEKEHLEDSLINGNLEELRGLIQNYICTDLQKTALTVRASELKKLK